MVLYGNRSVPTEMVYQILQYLLFRMWDDTKEDGRRSIPRSFHSQHKEECPKCGYALLKTLKKEWNEVQLQEQCSYSKNNRQPLPSQSLVSPSLKFQSAYEEFIGRFTFGIEALDSPSLSEP